MKITAAAALLTTTVALSACDKPKDRSPPPAPNAAAPQPPAANPNAQPMPPLPAWSAAFVGKPLQTLFPGDQPACVGNTEIILQRYGGAAPGVQIAGWGWDPASKAEIGRILIVDGAGEVVGVGESGYERPDVNQARPEIKARKTGWAASTSRTKGPIDAYGVVGGGKAVCRLGHLEF